MIAGRSAARAGLMVVGAGALTLQIVAAAFQGARRLQSSP
jgi:hypothetical protein